MFYITIILVFLNTIFAEKIPDVILLPNKQDYSQISSIIVAPGFGIGADAYEPLGKILQSELADQGVGLYYGGPHMTGNITTVVLKKANRQKTY